MNVWSCLILSHTHLSGKASTCLLAADHWLPRQRSLLSRATPNWRWWRINLILLRSKFYPLNHSPAFPGLMESERPSRPWWNLHTSYVLQIIYLLVTCLKMLSYLITVIRPSQWAVLQLWNKVLFDGSARSLLAGSLGARNPFQRAFIWAVAVLFSYNLTVYGRISFSHLRLVANGEFIIF